MSYEKREKISWLIPEIICYRRLELNITFTPFYTYTDEV